MVAGTVFEYRKACQIRLLTPQWAQCAQSDVESGRVKSSQGTIHRALLLEGPAVAPLYSVIHGLVGKRGFGHGRFFGD